MRPRFWKSFFKLTDPLFKKNKSYLKYKSIKLPDEVISAGLSISCDSKAKVLKKYVVQKYNDIDFFTLNTGLGIFEIRLITYKDRGKVFYTVHNLKTDLVFTVDEKAFKLLFKNEAVPIEAALKSKYMSPKFNSKQKGE